MRDFIFFALEVLLMSIAQVVLWAAVVAATQLMPPLAVFLVPLAMVTSYLSFDACRLSWRLNVEYGKWEQARRARQARRLSSKYNRIWLDLQHMQRRFGRPTPRLVAVLAASGDVTVTEVGADTPAEADMIVPAFCKALQDYRARKRFADRISQDYDAAGSNFSTLSVHRSSLLHSFLIKQKEHLSDTRHSIHGAVRGRHQNYNPLVRAAAKGWAEECYKELQR